MPITKELLKQLREQYEKTESGQDSLAALANSLFPHVKDLLDEIERLQGENQWMSEREHASKSIRMVPVKDVILLARSMKYEAFAKHLEFALQEPV